ncbi:hypothetical protein ES705_09486 [subsurface metagenome]
MVQKRIFISLQKSGGRSNKTPPMLLPPLLDPPPHNYFNANKVMIQTQGHSWFAIKDDIFAVQ